MKIILATILFFLSFTFFAESQTKSICTSAVIQGWSSPSSIYSSPGSYTSLNEAKEIIRNIISAVGLKQNFEVMPANIPNAAAVVYRGERYILYNPDFVSRLNAAAGNKWAAVSVLAHEVGHHLNGHTLDNTGSEPDKELEADEFSGFVLRRMGATLEQAQVAMKIAADYKNSITHPGQQQRLVAIATGWNNANNQVKGGGDVAQVYEKPLAQTPAVATTEASEQNMTIRKNAAQNVLAEKYILTDVHFNGISDAAYFITVRYHLVKVTDNRLYLIGNLVRIENKDYPFVITGADDAKLFVEADGEIVNTAGTQVGYLTGHK